MQLIVIVQRNYRKYTFFAYISLCVLMQRVSHTRAYKDIGIYGYVCVRGGGVGMVCPRKLFKNSNVRAIVGKV